MSIKKVVVIGPESTGKSTLSGALAKEMATLWVPEYARGYLEALNSPYSEEDLLEIARGQTRTEDEQAAAAKELLICDTDLQVIKVWSEHKYGRCNKWILEEIAKRRYDLYLLTYIDVLWEDDPLREHPEEGQRHYFYNIYRDIVQSSGLAWVDIRGNMEERLSTSIAAIKKYL